ncbi:MAG: alpha-hydroxy-acid oxidizing protein [Chloroflexota bacterium]|nr:alpha-hydroxy-acid oxidizing protein [Chloroflexota bacterium]
MPYLNLHDLEPLAHEKLPAPLFDFIAGGAEDEVTLRANRAAFEAIEFRPRVLVDVTNIDTSTSVLGQALPFPVMLAPVAMHMLAHPDGELATARAAKSAGTVMILSTMSSISIEDVGAAADGPKWFQLYCYSEKGVTERLVKRAENAGFSALCLTVDVPRLGRRERDLRHVLQFPDDVLPRNFLQEIDMSSIPLQSQGSAISAYAASLMDQSLTWDVLPWLRSITSMPVIVKGILTPEDAVLAVEHGAAAIVVSNHGGRQLDSSPATAVVLPEIVDAVGGRLDVIVDGGVRRGTDVLKALALGAKAVLIGRPYIWGLAVNGEAGVSHVLSLLRTEFEWAMALCGVTTVDQITRRLVRAPWLA